MSKNRVSYTLDSTLDSVNQMEASAEQFATEAGFQGDDIQEIMMAVREATINAVVHGNSYDPQKKVHVTFEHKPGTIEVTVQDQGTGFDAERVPSPLDPENLLKQSGRGIFLIRAYMDEVRFRDLEPGTEMVLIKHVRGAAADGKENVQS